MGNAAKNLTHKIHDLDSLDGHQFENAVGELFEAEGYEVEMGSRVNDKGRDLILRRSGSIAVVECKHYIGTVGRPVVQKLNSAISTLAGARFGFVVTSGTFSKEAKDYIKEIYHSTQIEIELIDFPQLVARGQSVQMHFVSQFRGNAIHFYLPWRDEGPIKETFRHFISSIHSHPRSPLESIKRVSCAQMTTPLVKISYALNKDFYASQRLLYTAIESGHYLYFADGETLPEKESSLWSSMSEMILPLNTPLDPPAPSYFSANLERLSEGVAQAVAHENSKVIHYEGKNHRPYQKNCQVNKEDVITSPQRILVRQWNFNFTVANKSYFLRLGDLPQSEIPFTAQDGFRFELSNTLEPLVLCNDCGDLVPKELNTFVRTWSQCCACQKTLCKTHIWRLPRFEVLPWSPYCSKCYPVSAHRKPIMMPWLIIGVLALLGVHQLRPLPWLSDNTINQLLLGVAGLAVFTLLRFIWHFKNIFYLKRFQPPWPAKD